MIYLVVVKFFVFVSKVVSIFSKILTWIFGGAKGYLCPQLNYWGGAPARPPKSTPMRMNETRPIILQAYFHVHVMIIVTLLGYSKRPVGTRFSCDLASWLTSEQLELME